MKTIINVGRCASLQSQPLGFEQLLSAWLCGERPVCLLNEPGEVPDKVGRAIMAAAAELGLQTAYVGVHHFDADYCVPGYGAIAQAALAQLVTGKIKSQG